MPGCSVPAGADPYLQGGGVIAGDLSWQSAQVPAAGALHLDHVAYFVPDRDAVHAALRRLGFAPTPFSLQQHRASPQAPLVPVGTGNHCVMLREGYLEFLVPLDDTAVAGQLQSAIARYVGAHSIVFGTADAAVDAARLAAGGFAPLPTVDLQRTVDVPDGEETARFSVVRVPPGTMPEGRIQFCRHHTPGLVWQARWVEHPNRAVALSGVDVCVPDVVAAAERFGRFTGIEPVVQGCVASLTTARGRVRFVGPGICAAHAGSEPPALPWIAGCEIASSDLAATHRHLEQSGLRILAAGPDRVLVETPPAVGGVLRFVPSGAAR